jgi:hypothetical protein
LRSAVTGIAALLAVNSAIVDAQTIAPVVVEYQGKARGKFQLANGTLYPMNVVLEPVSFSVDSAGQPRYRPLDPAIHLRLSATSFRVSPKEMYTVYYEASADRLPTWFTVYATVTGARPSAGLQVALQLPHTVYLLTKQKLARDSVVLLRATISDSAPRIVAEVENRGPAFGRVKQVEIRSAMGRKSYPGFPLFPGQRRTLQIDWDRVDAPQRLVLIFDKFTVDSPISPR